MGVQRVTDMDGIMRVKELIEYLETQPDVQKFKTFLSKMETLLEKEKEKQLKTA